MRWQKLLLTGLIGLSLISCDSRPRHPVGVEVAVVPSEQEPAAESESTPTPPETKTPSPTLTETPPAPTPKSETVPAKEFRFVDDAAGRALAEQLPPRSNHPLETERRSSPLKQNIPEWIADPSHTASLNRLGLPRLPDTTPFGVRPHALAERVPTDLGGVTLSPPMPVHYPEAPLVRVEPNFDGKQPAPLPILGKPVPDRAPLTDPTIEFTSRSVLQQTIPLRSEPDSHGRMNLPDPFEHRETIRFQGSVSDGPAQMPISTVAPRIR